MLRIPHHHHQPYIEPHAELTRIRFGFDSDSTPILLGFNSDFTPIRLGFYSDSTRILLRFDSDFTRIRLGFDSDSTPIRPYSRAARGPRARRAGSQDKSCRSEAAKTSD